MFQRLKLIHDDALSNFAFNFNLRRYAAPLPEAYVYDQMFDKFSLGWKNWLKTVETAGSSRC